jgi:hypothetical protein
VDTAGPWLLEVRGLKIAFQPASLELSPAEESGQKEACPPEDANESSTSMISWKSHIVRNVHE